LTERIHSFSYTIHSRSLQQLSSEPTAKMNFFVVNKQHPINNTPRMANMTQILMTTFAAFVSAIPHAGRGLTHGHQLAHGLKHHVQVAHAAPIAERSISYDGSCGSWSGLTCAEGFCCGYVMIEIALLEVKLLADTYIPVPSGGVATLPSTAAWAARLALVIAALAHRPRPPSSLSPARWKRKAVQQQQNRLPALR
jgi:hypothetical protein